MKNQATHKVYSETLEELCRVESGRFQSRFEFVPRRNGTVKVKAYHLIEEVEQLEFYPDFNKKIVQLLKSAGLTKNNLSKWYKEHGNFTSGGVQELSIILLPSANWSENTEPAANQLSIF